MPWFSIIMALISFLLTKKKTGDTTKALAAGALVGLGSYYVSHNTDWGRANLGSLDGVPQSIALRDKSGNPILKDGQQVYVPAGSTVLTNPNGTVKLDASGTPNIVGATADVLKSWGGTGTAAVIGTTTLATSSSSLSKYLPWVLAGGALLLLTRS